MRKHRGKKHFKMLFVKFLTRTPTNIRKKKIRKILSWKVSFKIRMKNSLKTKLPIEIHEES